MKLESLDNPLTEGLRLQPRPAPCAVVIFGATGDLTRRKLMPGLFNLARQGLLPQCFRVIEKARHRPGRSMSDLESRLHYSSKGSGRTPRGLPHRAHHPQPASRFPHHDPDAGPGGGLERAGHEGPTGRATCSGDVGQPGLFRRLSIRHVALEPDPGTAGLLRSPSIPADR